MLLVYVLWSLYIIKETKFTLLYLIILSQVKYKNHTNNYIFSIVRTYLHLELRLVR